MRSLSSGCKSILIVLVLVSLLLGRTYGCLDCGWDFLSEELFPGLCPILSSTTSFLKELFSLDDETEEGPIPSDLIADCFKCGRDLSKAAATRANKLVREGATLDAYPSILAHFFFAPLPADVKKASKASQEMLAAAKVLQMKVCSSTNVTPNTFMAFLENQVIKASGGTSCKPYSGRCSTDKYRSYDGTCNNLQKPGWGRKMSPFTRLTAVRYADGIYSMPVAKSGRPLPGPREITTRLFTDVVLTSNHLNYLNMQWGQFVTHDITMHLTEGTDEGGINCCVGEGTDVLPPELLNDKCIPIIVPDDDPFYKYYGIKCLNLVRSLTTPRDDCSLGYAEQMNAVTSYLDGSQIYGLEKTRALSLRTKKGGRLREENKKKCKRGFLPSVSDRSVFCDLRNVSDPCYLSGDPRINQTPPLAMMHTLFLREHNRVAAALSSLNPSWGDERVYQETRRIVIAELQHITYQEWLPLNLGESYVRYYRISPSSLYTHDYSAEVNAAVLNSVSAGALRALHTMVPDAFLVRPASASAAHAHILSDHYQNPSVLEQSAGSFDAVMRGVLGGGEAAPGAGTRCTAQMSRLLFKSDRPWGLDLVAIDVQKGRDHGIGSYNDFREICGLRRARSFHDLSNEIPQEGIKALSREYENVDDIDMYVGSIMERPVQGSVLGPTLQCVVAEQFYRTRVGDRFFYDNGGMTHSFSTEQLRQLKKTSMARIICDNTDLQHVQKRAFERESSNNPTVSCDNLPSLDLSAWKKSSIFD